MRLLLLLIALLAGPTPPQISLVLDWQSDGLHITYGDGTGYACLYLDGTLLPDSCGGSAYVLSAATPGRVIRLMLDGQQRNQQTIPARATVALPLVARP